MPKPWPACVARLPVCPVVGLPVPFSSGVDACGRGRFGRNDPLAKLTCGLARRCGICGEEFDGADMVFLVADRPMADPVFTDPPSHEWCAEASLTLCPRIVNGRTAAAPAWQMWVTGSYELVPGRRAVVDFKPGPPLRIRRFTYNRAGRLREVTSGG
jgi:hypothetical protein